MIRFPAKQTEKLSRGYACVSLPPHLPRHILHLASRSPRSPRSAARTACLPDRTLVSVFHRVPRPPRRTSSSSPFIRLFLRSPRSPLSRLRLTEIHLATFALRFLEESLYLSTYIFLSALFLLWRDVHGDTSVSLFPFPLFLAILRCFYVVC